MFYKKVFTIITAVVIILSCTPGRKKTERLQEKAKSDYVNNYLILKEVKSKTYYLSVTKQLSNDNDILPAGIIVSWNATDQAYIVKHYIEKETKEIVFEESINIPKALSSWEIKSMIERDIFSPFYILKLKHIPLRSVYFPTDPLSASKIESYELFSFTENYDKLEITYITLDKLEQKIQKIFSQNLTSLQKEKEIDKMKHDNIYIKDSLKIKNITKNKYWNVRGDFIDEYTVENYDSKINGIQLNYIISSKYAETLNRNESIVFWGYLDAMKFTNNEMTICIIDIEKML